MIYIVEEFIFSKLNPNRDRLGIIYGSRIECCQYMRELKDCYIKDGFKVLGRRNGFDVDVKNGQTYSYRSQYVVNVKDCYVKPYKGT